MSATISSTGGPIYFFRGHEHPYGFLSQWFNAPFTAPSPDPDAEPMTFSTTEQYMMYQKAILFKDSDIADQIMLATTPAKQRSLGRKVKNFDRVVWDAHREEIVEEGNWNKFCSSKKGSKWKEMLVQTGDRELVEVRKASKLIRPMTNQVLKASPFDRIWGVGYSAENAEAHRSQWGANLLGKALMRMRERINTKDNTAE